MYLDKLYTWTWKDWEDFFSQFPGLTKRQRVQVKQILILNTKKWIESRFDYLEKIGILNWIWPWYMMKIFRKLVSYMFRWVKYEWHDIMYAIWWKERDRLDADYWLLKYSVISIREFIIKSRMTFSPLSMILVYLASSLQFIMAFFCYIMVVLFWRFWSFRYLK